MLNQLNNIGIDEREKLARNPYLQHIQQPSRKDRFLSGLASGLNRFAEKKLAQMDRQNRIDTFHRAGFRPEVANMLLSLQEADPAHFTSLLQHLGAGAYQEGVQPLFGKSQPLVEQKFENGKLVMTEAERLKHEQHKEKLRPELKYLDDLDADLNELEKLINDPEDPVSFGYKSSISSAIPVIGQQLLSGNTGEYNALSNKFHTDAASNAGSGKPGGAPRSIYHLKIYSASKPGLDKTKEQNEKLIKFYKKQIKEKKSKFLKAHPEFEDEISISESPNQMRQDIHEKPEKSNLVEPIYQNGKLGAINPATGKWQELRKRG